MTLSLSILALVLAASSARAESCASKVETKARELSTTVNERETRFYCDLRNIFSERNLNCAFKLRERWRTQPLPEDVELSQTLADCKVKTPRELECGFDTTAAWNAITGAKKLERLEALRVCTRSPEKIACALDRARREPGLALESTAKNCSPRSEIGVHPESPASAPAGSAEPAS